MPTVKSSILILWLATLAAMLILAPTVLVAPDWVWHDQQRVAQGALLLLSVSVLMSSQLPLAWVSKRIATAVALLVMLGAVSAALGAAPPAWALLEWSGLVLHLALLSCVVGCAIGSPEAVQTWVGWALGAFAALYGAKLMAGLLAAYTGGWPIDTRGLIDGFSNRRFFGQYATLVWPLLVALAADPHRCQRWRRGMTATACLVALAILVSQTRGTVYGLLGGIAVLAVARHHGRWWRTAGLAALGGAALYLALIWLPGWLRGDLLAIEFHLDDAGLSGRGALWRDAITLIKAHPGLGIGPMGFATLHHPSGAHPHSGLLQIAAEWGLPAALLATGLVVWGLWRLVRRVMHRRTDAWGAGLLVALASSLTQSLVDGVLVMPLSQVALTCCAGLAMAWAASQSTQAEPVGWVEAQRKPSTPRPFTPLGFTGSTQPKTLTPSSLGLLLTMLLVTGVMLVSLALTLRMPINGFTHRTDCEAMSVGAIKPRFWSCGWITPPP